MGAIDEKIRRRAVEIMVVAPEEHGAWTITHRRAVLVHGRLPGRELGWWLSWVDPATERRRDELVPGTESDQAQAMEYARNFFAANGI
ncbi:hypothetical protein ACFS5L_25310 [Streptomyces phyllanthi]|uniref:Uncharacterized protein n=1 Tax=Streptomyces phyllanthi TaxID=1803180 RepID=A0A5N8W777_9ACTN|nr:hypothetical protein [Streptomyces phyllanthi]MPY43341.1 hypothetical protein [Streptomyces phyllanthi]